MNFKKMHRTQLFLGTMLCFGAKPGIQLAAFAQQHGWGLMSAPESVDTCARSVLVPVRIESFRSRNLPRRVPVDSM